MIANAVFGGNDVNTQLIAKSTFLVIDDFLGMRGMLTGVLRNCGAQAKSIDTASNGPEAIQLLSKRRYDIVLCDFNLGAGQNGMQVLEEAKFKDLVGPSCCWIMVTAEKTVDTVMGTAEVQPDAYLIKPLTEAILTSRIARIKAKKEAFIEIDQAISAHNYLKAIRLCEERATTDKANALELLRIKCSLLTQSGQAAKARDTYEKILAARDVPWAQLGLARIHQQSGKLDAACQLLEQLIDQNRSYLEAYDLLAECYQALNENDKAENVLDRAVALSPNSHTRQRALGELAYKAGKLDRAEQAFRKTLKLAEHSVRKSPDAYLGLARTVGAKADPQEALNILHQMDKTFDSDEVRLRGKAVEGYVYHQNGHAQQAADSARELAALLERSSLRPDPASIREMAELLLVAGDREQGLALLQAEIMNNPDDSQHLDAIQAVFRKVGLASEGNELVTRTRREAGDLMNAGILLARDGDFRAAIAKVREALEKMPRNVRLLLNSAYVMISCMEQEGAQLGLLREAKRHLLTANRLSPSEPRYADLMQRLEALTNG